MIIDPASAASTRTPFVESLPQLISALVGGSIAFAVSLATNRSSNARLRDQFALERAASTAKERRAKGEELFVLLHYWTSSISVNYLSMGMAMQGKLTFDQVLDSQIQRGREFSSKYEAPRIWLYIKAYFPACSALHSELVSILSKLNTIDTEFKHAYEDGDFDGSVFLPDYIRLQKDFERCNALLQEKLIEELRQI